MFRGIYQGKRVLVTGHTGFKGSWLCAWLHRLGAEIGGLALAPDTTPDLYSLLKTPVQSELCDIRDFEGVKRIVRSFRPEIVFHLAAQPLVRTSYREPRETFETNVMGTVDLLEACRQTPSVRAVVVVTTDKCYANPENGKPFTEDDPLGGFDPYSASKGAAEIAAASYRSAFFSSADSPAVATARAGNVIGGGDWAADRLIPDLVRAAAAGTPAEIRFPDAVRPWQHVLEALGGYLTLGAALLSGGHAFASAWNFGPAEAENFTVGQVIGMAQSEWDKIIIKQDETPERPHEAGRLLLDCGKARDLLHWHPVWDTETAVRRTIRWYRDFYENGAAGTSDDLGSYCDDARKAGLEWAL
ncbi:MAG: CDP-glucose 4,6-dehydratase [Lentisphaeria bacterium]|nr:CDP-glucose 4,6-dehydratase [Lentisphaeria bacterium]